MMNMRTSLKLKMDKCAHGVYVPPADWQIQAAHGIRPSRRVAWGCWLCREYDEVHEFSPEKLIEIARANDGKDRPVRLTDSTTVLIKNADYDDADILLDVGGAELQEVVATD
jgi:hypothetical protein